jgi:hypothetical protein
MPILSAQDACSIAARLFPGEARDLLNPLVYANYAATCDAAQRRSLLSRNLPRRVAAPAIDLLRYPPGTLVNGDRSYLTVCGEAIIAEQCAPWCQDPEDEARRMRAAAPGGEVDGPCLLLARYGENTWGHWVAEMLAKAAIAERLAPGRFRYAVPWWTTERMAARGYADAVLDSLAAYGIGVERLVRLCGFTVYRFAALHDISGLAPGLIHSGVAESLRLAARAPCEPPKRTAMLRAPPLARAVFNRGEIAGHLAARDFDCLDPGALTFGEQIAVFAGGGVVVASLGSEFWPMLFAPPGAPCVSLAPAAWPDGYFIPFFQHAEARHADLRGPSTLMAADDPVRSSHLIDPRRLDEAIDAVLRPAAETVTIDGEILPRRVGACLVELRFGRLGNAAAQLRGEWSGAEAGLTWSLGDAARLLLPAARGAAWLEIEGQGHVYPHLPTRPLAVEAGGETIGRFEVIGRTRLMCRLPRDLPAGAELTFRHPVCPSPRMMGGGADDRPLGFGFESLRLHAGA